MTIFRKICHGVCAYGVAAIVGTSAGARDLIYSNGLPPIHPSNSAAAEPYAKAVKEATGGEVNISISAGGALAGLKETMTAIETGAVDMGLLSDVYTPASLPDSVAVSDMFTLGKDARVMTAAVNENLMLDCANCQENYEENMIQPLLMYSTTPYHLMCKDLDPSKLENLQGARIRATGAIGRLMASFGATTVNITTSESYEAIQRGTIDCVAGPFSWMRTLQLWDQVTHVSNLPLGTSHGVLAIGVNEGVWTDLEPAHRRAMLDAVPAAGASLMRAYIQDDLDTVATAKEKGIIFVEAGEDLVTAYKAYAANQAVTVAEKAKGRGAKNPAGDIATFAKTVKKWTQIVNGIGTGEWGDAEWAAYRDKIAEEIYANVSE